MNARFYVPSIGRFASADTIVPDPKNPQAYNRYSYVYNSPAKYVDPSHRSMDLRIRRNYTPICFKVKDMDASRVVLNTTGAERLPPAQFFTYINGLQKAVAFTPSDNDIQAFLQQHPVPTYPALQWLRQATSTIEQTPSVSNQNQTEQIRQLAQQGLSMREVQRQIFGYTGGAAYETVKPIYDQVRVS